MRRYFSAMNLAAVMLITACSSQPNKMIVRPDAPREPAQNIEAWEIIESQNGGKNAPLPEWVNIYLNGNIHEIENIVLYKDKYVFIGENRGSNFTALRQWASSFTLEQDLSRLVAARIEKRMVSAAALYPDDEYGDYFEAFIKKAIDTEFSYAIIEDRFWIKRRILLKAVNADELPVIEERFEFYIMVSAGRITMQNRIRSVMESIKTPVPPTRDQAAAINRIKQTFFERF